MIVKYSPDFAAAFKKIPKSSQDRFRVIDRKVASGDFSMFDRMGWAYFVDIDDTHSAMGSYRKNDDVFYWMVLGSPETMPVIL